MTLLPHWQQPELSAFSIQELAALYEALHGASESLVAGEHAPRLDQPKNGLMGRQAEYLDNIADYIARHRDEVARAVEARPRPTDPFEASIWAGIIVQHEVACNGTSEVPELVRIADDIRQRNIAEGC